MKILFNFRSIFACSRRIKYFKLIFSLFCVAFTLVFIFKDVKQNMAGSLGDIKVGEYRNSINGEGMFVGFSTSTIAIFERNIDGDTFEVKDKALRRIYKIRIIGINSPESVDPKRKAECYGKEASVYLSKLLKRGDILNLIHDTQQDFVDTFGRTLAYVDFQGQDLGLKIIDNGYAREFTWNYKNPYERQALYKEAENVARNNKIGLWGKCVGTIKGRKASMS